MSQMAYATTFITLASSMRGHFIDYKIARSSLSIRELLTQTDLGESLKVLGVLLP